MPVRGPQRQREVAVRLGQRCGVEGGRRREDHRCDQQSADHPPPPRSRQPSIGNQEEQQGGRNVEQHPGPAHQLLVERGHGQLDARGDRRVVQAASGDVDRHRADDDEHQTDHIVRPAGGHQHTEGDGRQAEQQTRHQRDDDRDIVAAGRRAGERGEVPGPGDVGHDQRRREVGEQSLHVPTIGPRHGAANACQHGDGSRAGSDPPGGAAG